MTVTNVKWVVLAASLALAGCNDTLTSVSNKAEHPLPDKLVKKMKAQGMTTRSPILMRIFKEENTLEIWKQKPNGRYEIVTNYGICKWSGQLGPKHKEGDRQAPEGYYNIRKHQMNPNSSYYLSFNMGFPNRFDRAHGRTGSNLMVHGACSSAGCYSMTDEQVLEIFGFARDAFKGGQDAFQVQAYPFRLTPENMARYRDHASFDFWNQIKEGYDHFEITKRPPKVDVCEKRYVFNQTATDGGKFRASAACPEMSQPQSLKFAYSAYQKDYQEKFDAAVANFERDEAREKEQEVAKIASEARAQERAILADQRSENVKQTLAPVASLFSRQRNANTQDSNALSANLYKTNTQAAPTPQSVVQPIVPAPSTQVVATAGPAVPVPTLVADEAATAAETNANPKWKFWKRKANNAQ
jgi:murein L,D-transpeptidase YafK